MFVSIAILGASPVLAVPSAPDVELVKQARRASNVSWESFVLAATMTLPSAILVKLDFISQRKVREIVFLVYLENFKIR